MGDVYDIFTKTQLIALLRYKDQTISEKDEKIGEFRRDLNKLNSELRIERAKLKLRPSIEFLERNCFPAWLLNSEHITHMKIKWLIALRYELTETASVIVSRLGDRNISIRTFINGVTLVHNLHKSSSSSSKIIQHDKKPEEIKLDDDEWKLIYEWLRIHDQALQQAITVATLPIYEQDLTSVHNVPVSRFIFHCHKIGLHVANIGEVNTENELKRRCSTYPHLHQGMTDFLFPTLPNGRYTNEVIFLLQNANTSEAHQLKNDLVRSHRNGVVQFERIKRF